MDVRASPYVAFRRALDAGQLLQAETAARELAPLSIEDTLRLVLLLRRSNDYRYEHAATKWLGLVLVEHPRITLHTVAEVASCRDGLDGASPDVARSRLAVLLRHVGLQDLAVLLRRRRSVDREQLVQSSRRPSQPPDRAPSLQGVDPGVDPTANRGPENA